MGEIRGFLKFARKNNSSRQVCERVKDYNQVAIPRLDAVAQEQAARCMNCGTPFCHSACPIGNYIPEWNDFMFRGNWKAALALLEAANNLPEITGRLCPGLCEYACVLGLNDDAITIRENELSIIEFGFENGMLTPLSKSNPTGKEVAVVGSGPAGLSAAAQLNRAGHRVTVFEKDDAAGGILRYGIPDFKLEKHLIQRRLALWKKEGIVFKTGIEVGKDYPGKKLLVDFDAVCLALGSRQPRDLPIEGRDLKGIHFAMDYLIQSNMRIAGKKIEPKDLIDAKGKKVVIIGGGDTGADCLGTAHRQGASCVVQIEVMPRPAECRTQSFPWPSYPLLLKTSSSHQEGGERCWSVLTKRFIGANGQVKKLACVRTEFTKTESDSCPVMREIKGSEFEIEADLIIIAVGFLHTSRSGILTDLDVAIDQRGNVKTDAQYKTSVKKVFGCGDMRRGQSLVVWAISEGRRAAYCIDIYLMGKSNLPLM